MDAEQYRIMFDVETVLWWYRGMRHNAAALLGRYLASGRSYELLDAGCGTGGTTVELSRFGPVTGIDFSNEALPFAHSRGLKRLVRGSVMDLPFTTHSFDALTSFDVIYHRAVADDMLAVREFHRVLRPGGIAIIRVPAFNWLRGAHDVAVHTERRYTVSSLRSLMRQAGFDVLHANYHNALLFPLAAGKRLTERFLPAAPGDLSVPPPAVNSCFEGLLAIEGVITRRVAMPFGLSAIAVGRA